MKTSIYFSERFKKILEKHTEGFRTEKSKSIYTACIADLCNYCRKDFLDIGTADIWNFFDSVKRRPDDTKSFWLRTFRSIAKTADTELGTSIREKIYLPNAPAPRIYVKPEDMPSIKDIDRLLTYLAGTDRQLFLMLTLMVETGITVKELLSVKKSNVIVDTGGYVYLMFPPEKEEEGITRYIPLSRQTAELVRDLGTKRGNDSGTDNLFLNSCGRPVSARTVQGMMQKACEKAGTKPVRFKDVKDVARAAMLSGGASSDSLAYQTGASKSWFFRLNRLVTAIRNTPASRYNILRVVKNNDIQEEKGN